MHVPNVVYDAFKNVQGKVGRMIDITDSYRSEQNNVISNEPYRYQYECVSSGLQSHCSNSNEFLAKLSCTRTYMAQPLYLFL